MLKSKKEISVEKLKKKTGVAVDALYVILLAFAVTSLMVLYLDRLPSNVVEGSIAVQDVRADQNYDVIDIQATTEAQDDAVQKTLPVYNFDSYLVLDLRQKIQDSFALARKELRDYYSQSGHAKQLREDEEGGLKQDFLLALGMSLSEADYKLIYKDGFSEELEQSLVALAESVQKKSIIQDRGDLLLRKGLGIVLRIIMDPVTDLSETDKIHEEIMSDFSNILSLEEARDSYKKVSAVQLQKQLNLEFIDQEKIKVALMIVPSLIKANISLDKQETAARKDRAKSNVQNIVNKLQKGQIIIRSGDRYENRDIMILNGIRSTRLQSNIILKFVGVFSLILTTLLVVFFFSKHSIRNFKPTRKDLNFLGLMLLMCLAILRLGSFFSSSLQDAISFSVNITTFYYAIPVVAGVMIVRMVFNSVTSLIFAIVLSLFSGLFLEQNFQLTVYYFLSSIVAAYFTAGAEKRSSVLRCGLYVGLINVVAVLSLNLINTVSMTSPTEFSEIATNALFAFFGGTMAALTVFMISPIVELMFNYTTNIQLLELANMNHPLLREMVVRSPGTYLHSQLVGTLAEAGTRAIGGNALLARVGSYYHDIGKMKKPQYFVENQKGENPHDHLVPSMSALVIDAHVKDGLEMAREYKLPKVIADFIPEHQGTKLIGYFYYKALKEAGDDKSKIDERHYRYAGPKPQSREAGVIMLADTIEAAVRSMSDKSPQKIRAQVEKLVNMHFVDGQLDECDLTLRDLHQIVDAFVKILIGIYHQRVEYPEDAKQNKISLVGFKEESATNPNQSPASAASNISPLFKEKRQ